jgi:hypothetical protein
VLFVHARAVVVSGTGSRQHRQVKQAGCVTVLITSKLISSEQAGSMHAYSVMQFDNLRLSINALRQCVTYTCTYAIA